MVFTDAGKELTALQAWTPSGNRPIAIAIGSGSGTAAATNLALIAETDRNLFTGGSVDYATPKEVSMQADWNSIDMSGLKITEFGVFNTSGTTTGSVFAREAFNSINFDGTNELQIQITFQTF